MDVLTAFNEHAKPVMAIKNWPSERTLSALCCPRARDAFKISAGKRRNTSSFPRFKVLSE
jgi:hypothetical protein